MDAAQRLQGTQGIGVNDILPLLQGLLSGVQGRTNAQQGQGTLLDTLLPAVTSYMSARNSGRPNSSAIGDALSAAFRGSQQTYQQPFRSGNTSQQVAQPRQDPGAVSANSLLKGLFNSLTNL
jgi:dihydroxyacetone kinase-like protein